MPTPPTETAQPPARLAGFSVRGLFGLFDYDIALNTEDRITIMHGPNGSGKTILLKMLDALYTWRPALFRQVPFRSFRVQRADGSAVTVERVATEGRRAETRHRVVITGPAGEHYELTGETEPRRRHSAAAAGLASDLARRAESRGPEGVEAESALDDLMEQYERLRQELDPDMPAWLDDWCAPISVRLVDTNRLLVRQPSGPPVAAVRVYADQLANTIQDTLARSAEIASSLDRTFPTRLMQRAIAPDRPPVDEADIRRRLAELEAVRARLTAAGLLDRADTPAAIPEGADSVGPLLDVLAIYVEDAETKLAVFDDLLRKVELLQRIIGRRFRFKTIAISKQGLAFRAPDGAPLPPESLSSGEQHELVLLYELLFDVAPRTLVLIDEPELSLHIAWQQEFLHDLAEITALADYDVLIATHSPDIIADRWDLTVELGTPEPPKGDR